MKKQTLILALCLVVATVTAQTQSKEARDKIMLNNVLILCVGPQNLDICVYDLPPSSINGYKLCSKYYSFRDSFGKLVRSEIPKLDTIMSCDYDLATKEYEIRYDRKRMVFKENWRDSLCFGEEDWRGDFNIEVWIVGKDGSQSVVRKYDTSGKPKSTREVTFDAQGRIIEYDKVRIGYTPDHKMASIHTYTITTGRNFGITYLRIDNTLSFQWQGNRLVSSTETEESAQIKVKKSDIVYYDIEETLDNGLWGSITSYRKNQNYEGGRQQIGTTTRHFVSLEEERRAWQQEQDRIADEKRLEATRIAEEKRVAEEKRREEQRLAEERRQEQARQREEQHRHSEAVATSRQAAKANHEKIIGLYMRENALGKALAGDVVSSRVIKGAICQAYGELYSALLPSDDEDTLLELLTIQQNVIVVADRKTKTIEKTLTGMLAAKDADGIRVYLRDKMPEIVDK